MMISRIMMLAGLAFLAAVMASGHAGNGATNHRHAWLTQRDDDDPGQPAASTAAQI